MCRTEAEGGRCANALSKDLARARADLADADGAANAAHRLLVTAADTGPGTRGTVASLLGPRDALARWRAADEAAWLARRRVVQTHAELACTPSGAAALDASLRLAAERGYDEHDNPLGYLQQVREERDVLASFRRQAAAAADPARSAPAPLAPEPERAPRAAPTHTRTQAGQTVTLTALRGAEHVGEALRYVEHPDRIEVLWVEVPPDQRGRGIAAGLLKDARAGREVVTESLTDDGSAWVDALWERDGIVVSVEEPDEDADLRAG